jgi:phosphoribosylglycinamide formyltransferase-1
MDLNVHQAVLDRGCKITGATLMFVDDGADTGPIIAQEAVNVSNDDTADSLKLKVQQAEQNMFLKYLPLLRDGKIQIHNKKVTIINKL